MVADGCGHRHNFPRTQPHPQTPKWNGNPRYAFGKIEPPIIWKNWPKLSYNFSLFRWSFFIDLPPRRGPRPKRRWETVPSRPSTTTWPSEPTSPSRRQGLSGQLGRPVGTCESSQKVRCFFWEVWRWFVFKLESLLTNDFWDKSWKKFRLVLKLGGLPMWTVHLLTQKCITNQNMKTVPKT